MAKNEIPKISDFPFLGLCDGFAKVFVNQNKLILVINEDMAVVLNTEIVSRF